jgi:hypothetical protein
MWTVYLWTAAAQRIPNACHVASGDVDRPRLQRMVCTRVRVDLCRGSTDGAPRCTRTPLYVSSFVHEKLRRAGPRWNRFVCHCTRHAFPRGVPAHSMDVPQETGVSICIQEEINMFCARTVLRHGQCW